jgi:poly(3-hydroxybutyrate) depolymerase
MMRTAWGRRKDLPPVAALLVMAAIPAVGRATQVAPPQELKPGSVIERVVCKNNSQQTYALYLPPNYSKTRKWPLIAAFDPGARGNMPVEHFKEAAERYGFIVCGSNNSRNGPMPPTGEAAKAMLGDVVARFAIDDKRLYLTGFSGGARAATTLAVFFSGQIAGVIGCGAGFAEGISVNSSLPFVYYGTVGMEDFNYPEMKQLDRTLEQARIVHRVAVFEGGHDWAPSDECVSAIEWIELHAMKSGRRARDDSFVDLLFATAQSRAIAYESAGRIFEAYLEYAAIIADFKGLKDITGAETKTASLKDSKAVKQALARDRDQETEQRRRVNEIFGLRANAQKWSSDPPTQKPFLDDLKRILSDLRRKSEAKEGSPERALARRVLNQYTVASFEQSMILVQTKKYELAAANLAIDAEAMPDNWRVSYNLACAYALGGDERHAIEALNNAIKKGFSNTTELENNHQLDSIRNEPGFKKIIEGLKKQGS